MAKITKPGSGSSELGTFLFSPVGTEENGMTLTVLSALARLGLDPWQEAARLAELPRCAAVTRLSGIIIALPCRLWSDADAKAIANRLVTTLPGKSASSASAQPDAARATRHQAVTVVLLGFVFTWVMFNLANHSRIIPDSNIMTSPTIQTSPVTHGTAMP